MATAKKQANKKFGFERKERFVARIGNADCMDLPSFIRYFSWSDAARASGCDPRKCKSVIILCDMDYAPFELLDDGDWPKDLLIDELEWDTADEWCKKYGYKLGRIIWLTP